MPLSIPYSWSETLSTLTVKLHLPVHAQIRHHPIHVLCSPLFVQISQPHTKSTLSIDLLEEIVFQYSKDENGVEQLPYQQIISSDSNSNHDENAANEVKLIFQKRSPALWHKLLYGSGSASTSTFSSNGAVLERRRVSRERFDFHYSEYLQQRKASKDMLKKEVQQRNWDFQKAQRSAMEKIKSDERVMAIEELFGAKKKIHNDMEKSEHKEKEKEREESKEQEKEDEPDENQEPVEPSQTLEHSLAEKSELKQRPKQSISSSMTAHLSTDRTGAAVCPPALPPIRPAARVEVSFSAHRANAPAREEKDDEDPRWREWLQMQEKTKKEKDAQQEKEAKAKVDEKQLLFLFEKSKTFFHVQDFLSAQSSFSSFLAPLSENSSAHALNSIDPLFFFQAYLFRARVAFHLSVQAKISNSYSSSSSSSFAPAALPALVASASRARIQMRECVADCLSALRLLAAVYPRSESPKVSSEISRASPSASASAVAEPGGGAAAMAAATSEESHVHAGNSRTAAENDIRKAEVGVANVAKMSDETKNWMLSGIDLAVRAYVTLGDFHNAVHFTELLSFICPMHSNCSDFASSFSEFSSFSSASASSSCAQSLASTSSSSMSHLSHAAELLQFRNSNQAAALYQNACVRYLHGREDEEKCELDDNDSASERRRLALEDLSLAVKIDPTYLPALMERCKLMLSCSDLQGCVLESTYVISVIDEQRSTPAVLPSALVSDSIPCVQSDVDEFYCTAFLLRAFSYKCLQMYSSALSDYSLLLSLSASSPWSTFIQSEILSIQREVDRRAKLRRAAENLSRGNAHLARELLSAAIQQTSEALATRSAGEEAAVGFDVVKPLVLRKSSIKRSKTDGKEFAVISQRTVDSLDLSALRWLLCERAVCGVQCGDGRQALNDCEAALALNANSATHRMESFEEILVDCVDDDECAVWLTAVYSRKSFALILLGDGWHAKDCMMKAVDCARRRRKRMEETSADEKKQQEAEQDLNALENDLFQISIALDQIVH